jgi:hypothetical protein
MLDSKVAAELPSILRAVPYDLHLVSRGWGEGGERDWMEEMSEAD